LGRGDRDHGGTSVKLADAFAQFERDFVARVLAEHKGKRTATAKALGISRKALWQKLSKYGLQDRRGPR
jgi:DNA-binding NtrC family response regulator